jgi:hypothetical protein
VREQAEAAADVGLRHSDRPARRLDASARAQPQLAEGRRPRDILASRRSQAVS